MTPPAYIFDVTEIESALCPSPPGRRLGPYEILNPLGPGNGRGVQGPRYRLESHRAIKVLPEHLYQKPRSVNDRA